MASLSFNDSDVFEDAAPWYRSPLLLGALGVIAAVLIGFAVHTWTVANLEQKTAAFLDTYSKASSNQDRLKLLQSHLDLPDSALELLALGDSFYQAKDFATAQAVFGLVADHFGSGPLAPSAWLGEANALDAQGKTDEAIGEIQKVTEATDARTEGYRPLGLLTLARLRQEKKDVAGARQALQELIAKYPQSSLLNEAQERLAELPAA